MPYVWSVLLVGLGRQQIKVVANVDHWDVQLVDDGRRLVFAQH